MNPMPLDPVEQLEECRHGVKGLCVRCAYGLRSWCQSKKGQFSDGERVEGDCVDFITRNHRVRTSTRLVKETV